MSERKILIRKEKKETVPELGREFTTVKAKVYFIQDPTKDYHTAYSIIPKSELGKDGEIVNSITGKPFIIFSSKFIDDFKKLRKLPQTIPLKDIGLIIAETGVSKDSKIVDAGLGSGALACYLAHLCSEVFAYEIRQDHIEAAKENISFLRIKNVNIKNKNIYDGIDETNIDLITLDVPEPWKVIKHAENALKIGGFLVSYSPSIAQTNDFVTELLKNEKFYYVKTVELIERLWEVDGRKVRPKSTPIGHSGFLSFARKVVK